MKDFWKKWQFWAVVAAVVLAIVCVVLWFVSSKFCYAASGLLIGALGGFIGGYFVGKKNKVAPAKKEVPAEEKPQEQVKAKAKAKRTWPSA